MSKLSEIMEGWGNKVIPPSELKDVIEQASAERMEICNNCEHHSKNHKDTMRLDAHCRKCGCTLSAKTRCLSCSCPIKKWTSIDVKEE